MKEISTIAYYKLNNKDVVFVGEKYNGSPLLMYKYDILLCSRVTLNKYYQEIIPKHLVDQGWKPKIIFL